MLINELIDFNLPFLKATDTVESALEIMDDFRLDQIAYSNGLEYNGVFDRDILENVPNQNQLLENLQPNFQNHFLKESQHIFEAINLIQSNDIQTIAVINESFEFKGSVKATDVLLKFSQLLGLQEIGAIITLKLNKLDYSLAEIARLAEADNVKIIGSFYNTIYIENETVNTLTLKINTQEISKLVATFERHGYVIENVFANNPLESIDKQNYDMLMKYLEI